MAIMDIFKGKKKAPPSPPMPYPDTPVAPQGLPIEQVQYLKGQGMADSQVVQYLQAQGYDSASINDAFAQIDAGSPAGPVADVPGMPLPEQDLPAFRVNFAKDVPSASVEEVAESIVEEKWREFTKELGKITEWKDKSESRLTKVEQELHDLKDDVENLHKAIVSKIGEYDRNLLDVGTEIKAMEKVFQKVLPELTGSVSELSRITKGIKGKKKKPEE